MKQTEQKLRKILELTRVEWDRPTTRPAVRENFQRVCDCRTPVLGGEVYASASEEKVFYHTCKSKCCPSCGNRGTQLWQRQQWCALPDIPFVGIVLTMPDVFWPIFRYHRHLQHDLPALGASIVQQWAWKRYRVRLCMIVVQHTFGGRLNHNPHLHIMVSAGGLDTEQARWVKSIHFAHEEIMALWRLAVTTYLRQAHGSGLLDGGQLHSQFQKVIQHQAVRKWNIHITRVMSKSHFLGYAGRYIRRLPISQRHLLRVSETEIVYQVKDTRAKAMCETRSTPANFVALLSEHIPDRYRHSMRYFGLLSPRAKSDNSEAVFQSLGQRKRARPQRISWRNSLIRNFQTDPLRDSKGKPMQWARRLRPS
jgi:hypothetical protein